jgi:Protein of unknown function (DUF3987)
MSFAETFDWPSLMESVAQHLLGEPNPRLSNSRELRWGRNGSMSVDLENGTFYDHEAKIGGGVIDLIEFKTGCDHAAAVRWLQAEGYADRPIQRGPQPASKPAAAQSLKTVAATYDYPDEDGVLQFQVVRYEPKDFRQRRPVENGEWVWNLDGVHRVLYRLPELIEAVAADRAVYVTEGEKDCDNVHSLGFAATTCAGGAKKWRDDYNKYLRDADVVLLPHNDESGREHAELVAASLHGIAKRVRVLDLAQVWLECPRRGGDVTNWIEDGCGTAEKLNALIEEVPDWKPSEDTQSAVEDTPSVANVASVAWPEMDEAAYCGLAGEVVKTIEPHTEADPVAVLIQFLAYFGNAVGPSPFYQVEAHKHRANLYAVLVGRSAKARKGTSGGRAQSVFTDPIWVSRMKGGLSSGEGLVSEVRDERKEWNKKEGREETVDPGVADKRLMVTEAEFAGALAVMERHGNTLSSVIRDAWDGRRLGFMTKHTALAATGAHISIVGHITEDELRANLTRTDMASGLANRFLFACVRRSKHLPFGGNLDEATIGELASRVAQAIERAKDVGRVTMTEAARQEWAAVYEDLSADQPGLLGAITARAEAQVVRLALIYALLDCPARGEVQISVKHLDAAIAVWEYCEASAAHIFGNALGDPVADEILRALRHAGKGGMTRTAIRDLFGRHRSADRVGQALALLLTSGRARTESKTTAGRPSELWFAVGGV